LKALKAKIKLPDQINYPALKGFKIIFVSDCF